MDQPCKYSKNKLGTGGYVACLRVYKGVTYYALHRYVYAKVNKEILSSKDFIMHLCNNKACIEITHLRKGTRKENAEMAAKDGLYKVILSEDDVAKIRQLWHDYCTQQEIADQFGVSRRHISDIVNRKSRNNG